MTGTSTAGQRSVNPCRSMSLYTTLGQQHVFFDVLGDVGDA
jgi:hypothetical protein